MRGVWLSSRFLFVHNPSTDNYFVRIRLSPRTDETRGVRWCKNQNWPFDGGFQHTTASSVMQQSNKQTPAYGFTHRNRNEMGFGSGWSWVELDIESALTIISLETDVRAPLELKSYFWPRSGFHLEHGVWVSTDIAIMSWDFISNTVCDSRFEYYFTKHRERVVHSVQGVSGRFMQSTVVHNTPPLRVYIR